MSSKNSDKYDKLADFIVFVNFGPRTSPDNLLENMQYKTPALLRP